VRSKLPVTVVNNSIAEQLYSRILLTWPSFANIDKRQERLLCRWPCVRSLNAEIKVLTWPSFANIDKRQERLLCRWPCVRSLNAEIKVRSHNVTYLFVEDIFCYVSSLTMKRSLLNVIVLFLSLHVSSLVGPDQRLY